MALQEAFTASSIFSLYRNPKTPISLVSCISIPTPRKFINRKNYLRRKLLRTLNKPFPNSPPFPELPPRNPVIPNESPPEQSFSSDQFPSGSKVELEIQETEVIESVGISDNGVGKFPKDSILKFGLWLIGAFVFHTICAIWSLGSAGIDDKIGNNLENEDKFRVLEVGVNGRNKSRLKLLNDDEEEMEKKIEEIRVMAREARERERLEMKKNGIVSDDEEEEQNEGEDFAKSGIGKEVNDRLIKVQKKLENANENLLMGLSNAGKKIGDVRDGGTENLNEKERNADLLFKKKYKFRGSSSGQIDKPKGFLHSDHLSVRKQIVKDGGSGMLMNGGIVGDGEDDKGKQDLAGDDSAAGMPVDVEDSGERKQTLEATGSLSTLTKTLTKQRERRKQGKRPGIAKTELNGINHDKKQRRSSSTEPTKPRKSTVFETVGISREESSMNTNDDSKRNGLAAEMGQKESESKTDFWWLNLPYVLVILMCRGLDGEGERGLFTLSSSVHEKSNLSQTVAFEDRSDATNFCYILQSFFKDLEDFSCEIVPLTIRELDEAVKSDFMRVIVVKKGQLKLYAGQPLPDVEMALRSLVGQS